MLICRILPYITHLALHRAAVCNDDTHISRQTYSRFHVYILFINLQKHYFLFYNLKPLSIILLTRKTS